jgi:hypothetical protein
MEEVLRKTNLMVKVIILLTMLILATSALSASRVVATSTITIHAYIPQHTTVDYDEFGNLLFTSNNPNVFLGVDQGFDATYLTVVAK